jgi:predicted Rossmann fold nucleotide-binding protein DprA/Smf involved in DNA uptake
MSDYYAENIDQAVAHLPVFAQARRTDPPTSQQAARRAPVRGHAARVLEALRAGPAGQTEIGRRTGLLPHQVNKRLADLDRAGVAEPSGREVVNEGGFREREWRVME